ncbi:MAG: hypothetical protein ACP5Q0_03835 [Halothiobacillus sp.]
MNIARLLFVALLLFSLNACGALAQAAQVFGTDNIELSHTQTTASALIDIEPFDHELDLLACIPPAHVSTVQSITRARSLTRTTFRPNQLKPPPDLA